MSEVCWACRGYGYFSTWGKPSADPEDRKCLECEGSGKAPIPPEPKPVEKSGESLEEQALSYFKKANPIIAEDEYYTKNPERSMTYRAALWGLKQGEAERDRMRAKEKGGKSE